MPCLTPSPCLQMSAITVEVMKTEIGSVEMKCVAVCLPTVLSFFSRSTGVSVTILCHKVDLLSADNFSQIDNLLVNKFIYA